ncbi:uncharacterized protein SCHCODRAFT_02083873 [Schizophyllum commune H4-8]|uniref:uncharacterized protein n=1 Tax=Schizophyllum commune (strain H4-8 / FGSC 9210) TaxID=578458 RepID=UPI00215FFD35|nr:uncharacterized protein SCHCODRAFT_02083873 [Schizophyllum commune H4-8]KAI5886871.1 hypothetical protein SCHCODRAFT_02083873 [Schizophyllum commune H4-8]
MPYAWNMQSGRAVTPGWSISGAVAHCAMKTRPPDLLDALRSPPRVQPTPSPRATAPGKAIEPCTQPPACCRAVQMRRLATRGPRAGPSRGGRTCDAIDARTSQDQSSFPIGRATTRL